MLTPVQQPSIVEFENASRRSAIVDAPATADVQRMQIFVARQLVETTDIDDAVTKLKAGRTRTPAEGSRLTEVEVAALAHSRLAFTLTPNSLPAWGSAERVRCLFCATGGKMRESRRRWRRKPSGAVCVALAGGSTPVQCRLVNISNGGARVLGFIDASTLPERIRLFVRDRHVMMRQCRVAWRGTREIGVQFLGPARRIELSSGGHTTLLSRASAIEAET
jgi:hypothetical protein